MPLLGILPEQSRSWRDHPRGGLRRLSKADETPRRFTVGDHTIEVGAVTSRSRTPDEAYFTVSGDDGQSYVLRHEVSSDRWTLA